MTLGLTIEEVSAKWHEQLTVLNAKLAPVQMPPGTPDDVKQRAMRIPETDQEKYSLYNQHVDMVAAFMAIILANNKRIEEQLRAAGVRLPQGGG